MKQPKDKTKPHCCVTKSRLKTCTPWLFLPINLSYLYTTIFVNMRLSVFYVSFI